MGKKLIEILAKQEFFKQYDTHSLRQIAKLSKKISLQPGEVLIQEGAQENTLYILLSGSLEVQKRDQKITTVQPGAILGEMALLEKEARSATVVALSKSKLLSIDIPSLHNLISKEPKLQNLYHRFAITLGQRLRNANEAIVQALEKRIEAFKIRVSMGNFLVGTITAICFFTIALQVLSSSMQAKTNTTNITIPLMIGLMIFYFYNVIYSGLPKKWFGFTLESTKRGIFEGIVFSIPVLLIIVIIKVIVIKYISGNIFNSEPLFHPYAGIHAIGHSSLFTVWIITLFIYVFLISPLQEILARGGLQGPLEFFLAGRYRTLTAILVSNIIFSMMHLFISVSIAFLSFVGGLYLGWLYSRTHNLIGVSVAHAIIGVWALMIVGFSI